MARTSKKALSKAPSCPTPAPTPTNDAGYTLDDDNQRLVEGLLVPTDGERRHLVATAITVEACYVACSLVGFAAPFSFSVQTSTGACYW